MGKKHRYHKRINNQARGLYLGLVIVLFFFSSNLSYGVTKTSTGSYWGAYTSWSPMGVPKTTDVVIINSNMAVTSSATCQSLTVNSGKTLTVNSTKTLQVGTRRSHCENYPGVFL